MTTEPLMTEGKAAEFPGVAPATLLRWRVTGQPPIYVKLSRAVRYRRSDLVDFIESTLCSSISADGRANAGDAHV